jgi:two-component system chemotaxis response regulator CheY
MPVAAALKILVVDDHKAMRALVTSTLAELGCRDVFECEDGEEALAALRHRPIHLIISDLNMPKMDGLQLLAAVKQEPAWAKIGFIMLTSRGEIELVKQAIALGVNNYLRKPFSLIQLKQKVEAVMGRLT